MGGLLVTQKWGRECSKDISPVKPGRPLPLILGEGAVLNGLWASSSCPATVDVLYPALWGPGRQARLGVKKPGRAGQL